MSKFAELERAAQGAQADVDENFKRMLFDPSQQTGVNTLISSTLVEDLSKSFGESSGSIIPSRLVPRTTPSVDHADQDVEWWQTACSDALLANGMPDVPTLPCKRAKVARRLPSAPNSGSQSPSNPFWNDLAHLKRIKRTHHKLAVLRREAPGMYADPDLAEASSDDDEASLSQEEDLALNAKRKALRDIGTRNPESATSRFGQAALQIVCSAILEHAGFDCEYLARTQTVSTLCADNLLF